MPIANFNWYNPTRILFGKNTIPEMGQYLPEDKHYILCYGGGSIKKFGTYDAVKKVLGKRTVEDFGGIEANPDFDTLMKCVNRIKEIGREKCFLLSIGGGSVCDGVKFIAAACYCNGDPWEDLLIKQQPITEAVPIAVVLTLPATGSESNRNAVISRRSMHRKIAIGSQALYPVVSVLDPELTYTLPDHQTHNGVVDAFVHVCEQYVTWPCDADCQDRYSEGLMKALVKNGEIAVSNPKDYTARANIMWAANQALNHLIAQGVPEDWSTHMIGHELTANLGLDHGVTLAIVQPRLFEYKIEQKKEKLAMLGEAVFGIKNSDKLSAAKETIKAIEHFYHDVMKVPTKISECKCSQDKAWIKEVCDRFKKDGVKLGEHQDITSEDVEKILNKCY